MVLTNSQVSVLLARGGVKIRKVEAETNTSIELGGQREAQQRSAVIAGSSEARKKAKVIIKEMLEEEKIKMPNAGVESLLYDDGQKVKMIERKTGTSIQFDRENGDMERWADIFGNEDARRKAKVMMSRILVEKVRMMITNDEVEALFRGDRRKVKEIERETETTIQFDGKKGHMERWANIFGNEDARNKAKVMISRFLVEKMTMMITNSEVEAMLRKDGQNVKKIEMKTETLIQFGGKKGEMERLANIFGSEDDRRKAKVMIRKVVEEERYGRRKRSRSRECGERKLQRSGSRESGLEGKKEKLKHGEYMEGETPATVKKEVVTVMETIPIKNEMVTEIEGIAVKKEMMKEIEPITVKKEAVTEMGTFIVKREIVDE